MTFKEECIIEAIWGQSPPKYNKSTTCNKNDKFTREMTVNELGGVKQETPIALNSVIEALISREWDLTIMDEIMVAVDLGFFPCK